MELIIASMMATKLLRAKTAYPPTIKVREMAHNKTNINCSQKREKQQKLLYFSQRNPTQFKKVGTLYKVNAINRQTIDIHKIVDFDH